MTSRLTQDQTEAKGNNNYSLAFGGADTLDRAALRASLGA